MLRFLKFLFLLPLGVALVAFGVANRGVVTLMLEPFSPPSQALSFSLPLYAIIFAALAVGVILGSLVTWFSQGRYRKAGREACREAERLASENSRLKTVLPATATALLSR